MYRFMTCSHKLEAASDAVDARVRKSQTAESAGEQRKALSLSGGAHLKMVEKVSMYWTGRKDS